MSCVTDLKQCEEFKNAESALSNTIDQEAQDMEEMQEKLRNQKKDFEAILSANKEMNELIGKLKTDFAELDKRFNKKNIIVINQHQ